MQGVTTESNDHFHLRFQIVMNTAMRPVGFLRISRQSSKYGARRQAVITSRRQLTGVACLL